MKISALVHAPQFTLRTRFRGWSTILVRRFSSEGLQSSLQDELTSRKPNIIFDYISPTPSHLLNIALTDVLPKSCYPDGFLKHNNLEPPWQGRLPQGHHLVYFAPQIPGNQLLADGTDPLQSPGEPFVRRMWAGGGLQFDNSPTNQVSIGSERICCIESILDVVVKGVEPEEKIFVTIKREIGNQDMGYSNAVDTKLTRPWAVLETRDLVFMRQKTAAAIKEDAAAAGKVLKPTYEPDFSVSLTPPRSLLFRFSALTFNAHAIHLDPQYCREVEGHRNLLVHGPLSLVLMLSVLRSQLKELEMVGRFDYRNLAPLYANEEMKVCIRKSHIKADKYDVWIEGRDGGYAVKGTAVISQFALPGVRGDGSEQA